VFPKPDDIQWWYINLDHRADRRQHIAKELTKAGIQAQRFPALRFSDYKGRPENIRLMMQTPNTVGNWLSHLAVWEKVRGTDDVVGVLEDDALLCEDFRERLQYIHEHFDKAWDIFYLGATYHVNPPVWHKDTLGRDFEQTDIKYIHRVYGAFSNQGYLVNGRYVEFLLNAMDEKMPQSRGSDHAMIMLQPTIQCYSFTPGMVFQIDGPSDIGQGVTVFSHFLKTLGPHVWANRLEDFQYDSYEWAEGRRE